MKKEPTTPPDLAAAMAAGDWRGALAIAAKYAQLGRQKEAILKAHNALRHPDFYRELGQDPDDLLLEGVKALHERYGRTTAR